MELVAATARNAGHDVRIVDLQVQRQEEYFRELKDWRPDAVGFSLNYLANVPEVLDLAIHNYDKAIADYTVAIRLEPKDAQAYQNRGVAYEKKDEKAEAEEDFAQAKKLGYKPK